MLFHLFSPTGPLPLFREAILSDAQVFLKILFLCVVDYCGALRSCGSAFGVFSCGPDYVGLSSFELDMCA